MMRWFWRFLLLLVLALPLAMGVLLWMALEKTPLVNNAVVFTPAHIERAKGLVERNDPRSMRAGVMRTLLVSQADLDLAANYLANRHARGSTSIVLLDGSALLRATFEVPANPAGRYLNLDATLVETAGLPEVATMRVGRLDVPPALGRWLVRAAVSRLQASSSYGAAANVVKQVAVRDRMLRVQFEWNPVALEQLKSAVLPEAEQRRFQAYQALLVEQSTAASKTRALRLDELLVPLLQLAQQRTAASGDSAGEHRAALVSLAFYVNGQGLAAVIPQARDWPQPVYRGVTLAGRSDTPQHFMVSAALAASAGSPLSDAVGLYKELADARGGSGFSFHDLAADRAGTRLGTLAVSGAEGAARLQRQLARGLRETDLLPDVRDLPEFMMEAEFQRRFGGMDQPAYRRQLADIERRLAALPLYR